MMLQSLMTPDQPLQPLSLSMAIADRLRDRILAHAMPPGSTVNDSALAQSFGVSRTPVREALKLLCNEGLLTAHVRRGMTVTRLSSAQIREAQQLHRLLKAQLDARAQDQGASKSRESSESIELTQRLFRLVQTRLQLADSTVR